MAIRRRRKKLTSLVSRLDERVRSVELRPINLLTSGQIDAAVEIGEAAAQPTNIVSGTAPNEFRKVQDAYYYSKSLTGGSEDRVAIYLESDLNLEVGDTLEISGIHGTNDTDIDVSGTFEVKFTDTPPWDDRASWKHDPEDDQLPGVTITNEYSVKPATLGPTTWGSNYRRLQTKRLVDTFSITDTTVTLTMNAVHKFKVGDVVFVDIFAEDSRAYGVDGLFEITAVTSDTIEYELTAGVDTPTGDITPSSDVYVFPVARNFVPVGSTWADSSTNKIYVWDGIRWVDYSAVDVQDDGLSPNPPTGLSVSDEPKTKGPTGGYATYAETTLTWTAPTTNTDGSELTDLLGYLIKWRTSPTEEWNQDSIVDPSATTYVLELVQGESYFFEVYATDSGGRLSTAATATHTTEILEGDVSIYPPTDPSISIRLGTVKVSWDGRLKTGSSTSIAAPDEIVALKIYTSLNNVTFDLASTERVVTNDIAFGVLTDLTYNVNYYIKITVVNSAGVESPFSGVVIAVPKALVDTDAIASTLNTWMFNGRVVPAGSLADGSIDASSLFGDNVVVQDAIAANAIGANQLAANSVIAGKIGANAITASNIQANAITAGKISTNAITASNIQAGAITAVKIQSDAITADKIDAGAVTADAISAGAITANKIAAGVITADKLVSEFVLSNVISTGLSGQERIEIRGKDHPNPGIVSFDGLGGTSFRFYNDGRNFLDGTLDVTGIIEGGTIRTSSGSKRVQMRGSTNQLEFYSGGVLQGEIEGAAAGLTIRGSGSAAITVGTSSTSVNLGLTASGDIFSGVRLGQDRWISTGTRVGTVYYNTSGDLIPFSSDRRLKTNITSIDSGLDKINSLNPVTFNWNEEPDNPVKIPGLIAQEVAQVFPEDKIRVVSRLTEPNPPEEYKNDPMMTMDMDAYIPYLIKSIQELSAKNDELRARLDALEGN